MEYSDFPKDFIMRTQKNLKKYRGKFEVTNLINSCLGLIIIPKEQLKNNLPIYIFNDQDKKTYGISKINIKYEVNGDFSLTKTVDHIRNGIAHGRIQQRSSFDKRIIGLRIHDSYSTKEPENFSIELSVYELDIERVS